uniref:THAP domain-containing protein 11 n=1 Tax=Lygus hesperus TaxID=30085 RepID=A0A146MDV6_LYGHE
MPPELCCVKGCYTNISKHNDVVLYTFPDSDTERELRRRWIDAVQIANSEKRSWEPHDTSRLCSEHFVANCRSFDPSDPSYVPTIFPAKSVGNDYELLIDLDDSEMSDDCDSEVIEETSDCLFVVGKIKQEAMDEELTANEKKTLEPIAASKRKISRCPEKKKPIPPLSKENEAGSPKRSKVVPSIGKKLSEEISNALFTGKFSSDSSDPDFDADEFGDLFHGDEDEVSEKELSVSDKLKVALKTPTRPHGGQDIDSDEFHLSSDNDFQQKKRSRRKKKRKPARFNTKGSQAGLPGVSDGFVFCTTRDDDFNVGVQCNIFYEFKLILPNVEETSATINGDHSAQESSVPS